MMLDVETLKRELGAGGLGGELGRVYPDEAENIYRRARLARMLDSFTQLFPQHGRAALFSAPGRTEIGGNHTDHNNGRVLAAAVNLDAVAAASENGLDEVRVKSENYSLDTVDLARLHPVRGEKGRSQSLIRGICAGFVARGYRIGGFDAATASDVIAGSGLSSSAAFEVLICTVINHLFNAGRAGALEMAMIAQQAENEFFGKPCGLMDQTACAVGGFVAIDFEDLAHPAIEKINFDFAACGHALCIVDTGGSHSGLTGEYAAVRGEMQAVAHELGKSVLRQVHPADFARALPILRQAVGDRALLRAIHFFGENERVLRQTALLSRGDFEAFKEEVVAGGRSSYMFNQNVYTAADSKQQPLALALALSESLLAGRGAWRLHGGGFAGTIQAFVPFGMLEEYKARMESVFGEGRCHVLSVRSAGGVRIC